MKTYDPAQVSVVVGGRLLQGFAEDSFVEVERNEDMFSLQVGIDGEGTRNKSSNKSGQVRIKLKDTSQSNAILQGFADADELSNSGVVSILIKDASSQGTLAGAEQAWVKKVPNMARAKESGENEWIFETDVLKIMHLGN